VLCDADHPAEISNHGWFDILRRIGHSLARDGMWLRSAGLAYGALFATIPAAAVPVSIFGLVADPQSVHRPLEMLGGLLPSDASVFLADQMQQVAQASRIQLGAGLGGAALAALWGAWSAASGLIGALNVAYREEESRSFLRRAWCALLVALGAGVLIVLAFGLVALVPIWVANTAPSAVSITASLARWPMLAALCVCTLMLLYRFAPSRRAAKWRWVRPGAIAATGMWLTATTCFSFYAGHVPSYKHALGALGMTMLLLTWSYLTAFAVLFGAELNAELERQTSRDTTSGPARQRGRRGAVVADVKAQPVA
jgi:membrane protein